MLSCSAATNEQTRGQTDQTTRTQQHNSRTVHMVRYAFVPLHCHLFDGQHTELSNGQTIGPSNEMIGHRMHDCCARNICACLLVLLLVRANVCRSDDGVYNTCDDDHDDDVGKVCSISCVAVCCALTQHSPTLDAYIVRNQPYALGQQTNTQHTHTSSQYRFKSLIIRCTLVSSLSCFKN